MITRNSQIIVENYGSEPVKRACEALWRDIENTCVDRGCKGIDIVLKMVPDAGIAKECFLLEKQGEKLLLSASDDLGLIYGIYHISETFLQVHPFWFWEEQTFEKKDGYEVPSGYWFASKPYPVKFRGWFINDEVLFDGWRETVGETFPWEMAFETLLRLGGNMTIPGTDANAHRYKKLATSYGLYITHHHAEPMGARMFARAYPDLDASFDKYPELFRGLWKEAIEDQKDEKVIWNIGFRGQGDRPFWVDDPAYDTPAARGKLMSDLMREQYDMIKAEDENAICCMNLYGEIMELYRDGFLSIPEDVIRIWADNGFGKMVSRRQNNHNPRVPALPEPGDTGAHGIYYHASFYDLQAAAMMTMLPNPPEFVIRELSGVLDRNVKDFWIINCSNVKPHVYYLDLIAKMWRGEVLPTADPAEAERASEAYTREHCLTYFGTEQVAELFGKWASNSVPYGANADDHAGEQFPNHGARILSCAFVSGFDKKEPEKTEKTEELNWLMPDAKTLSDQVSWHVKKYEEGVRNYEAYLKACREMLERVDAGEIPGGETLKRQLDHTLIGQVEYLYYSYLGAFHMCRALEICFRDAEAGDAFIGALEETGGGKRIDYISAFYEAGLAKKAFATGYETMRAREEGIWKEFYQNDCEADIRQSSFVAAGLMSYLRILGDGPHFYKWQRHFQEGAGGDKVHLILRIKAHLTDEEIFELIAATRKAEG